MASTHQLTNVMLSASKDRDKYTVLWRYFKSLHSFFQSSSFGDFTLVVKRRTVLWISLQHHMVTNKSWATVLWKAWAPSLSRSVLLESSRTVNRLSPASMAALPWIFSILYWHSLPLRFALFQLSMITSYQDSHEHPFWKPRSFLHKLIWTTQW